MNLKKNSSVSKIIEIFLNEQSIIIYRSKQERINVYFNLIIDLTHHIETTLRVDKKIILITFYYHLLYLFFSICWKFIFKILFFRRNLFNVYWLENSYHVLVFLVNYSLIWVDHNQLSFLGFIFFIYFILQNICADLLIFRLRDLFLKFFLQWLETILYHVLCPVTTHQYRNLWPLFSDFIYKLNHLQLFLWCPRLMGNQWIQVVVPLFPTFLRFAKVFFATS